MDDSRLLPTYLGDYLIIDEIGRGGMKTVARGHRQSDLNPVAIALMRSRWNMTEEKIRFVQEFELLSKLDHPNIVKVHEAGEHEGQLYFVMELVNGEPLSAFIDSQAILNHETLYRIVLDICDGLGYAHQNGLIHRDVKPSNILLDRNKVPKITDFGLSKDICRSSQITRIGRGIGTPLYASPEQLLLTKQALGPYSDVYSLGMTLLEVLIANRETFVHFSNVLRLEGENFSLETAFIDFGFDLHPGTLQFLAKALEYHADRRIRDMDEFRCEFEKLEPKSLSRNSKRIQSGRKMSPPTKSELTSSVPSESTRVPQRYQFGELIGKGGMGEVWKAFDPVRDSSVVIKVLPDVLRSNVEELERLKKSFRLIHSMHHESICPVFDLYEDAEKGICLVMKYIEGIDLNQYCTRKWADGKDFSLAEACHILYPIAQAVDFAHSHYGVLHRDIKLENIMLNEDGTNPVLVDFGLAEQIRNTVTSLQQADLIPCTPTHLAPELWRGHPVTRASDQYALGVVAYQMLSRSLPFSAPSMEILKTNVLDDPVPGLHFAQNVNAALKRALSKNPKDRFPDCKQFIESLRANNASQSNPRAVFPSTKRIGFNSLLAVATLVLLGFILYKKLDIFTKDDKPVAMIRDTDARQDSDRKNPVEPDQQTREESDSASSDSRPGNSETEEVAAAKVRSKGEKGNTAETNDDSSGKTADRVKPSASRASLSRNLVEAYDELNRGQNFLEESQPKMAVESFTRAIELCASSASQNSLASDEVVVEDIDLFITALINRGNTYLQLKQFDPAVQDFTNADLAGCDKSVALFNRGLAYQGLNLWRNAIADADAVLAEDPRNHEALEVRGNSYFQLEEYPSAIADFEAAYRLNRKSTLREKIERCKSLR